MLLDESMSLDEPMSKAPCPPVVSPAELFVLILSSRRFCALWTLKLHQGVFEVQVDDVGADQLVLMMLVAGWQWSQRMDSGNGPEQEVCQKVEARDGAVTGTKEVQNLRA